MKILLIEDDEFKRRNIEKYLVSLTNINVSSVGSVNTAVKSIRNESYDLIITDMSLPTFEVGPNERGGRPQGFGGREILRQMDRFEINIPVIVVTQYARFDGPNEYMSLEELRIQLQNEHSKNYVGLVFYDSAFDSWKNELKELLNSLLASNKSGGSE